MLIAALLRSVGIPLDCDRLLGELLLIHGIEMHVVSAQADHFLIFDEINLSGILEQRRHIGRDKASILVLPDYERAVLPDCKDLVGVLCKQNAQRIGPLHAVHHLCDRLERISFIIIVNQMRQHLRVRVRDKGVALGDELFF